ncbi:MAG: hypothetical protein MJZ25_11340 [Fibrobacter sp.]|nr:hypothetical protein [Fibrobacter sp.]
MMNKFMKTALVSAAVVAAGSALVACATQNLVVKNLENFQNKTGVIGVFRQPAFYCEDNIAHYVKLGDSTIVVKPGFSKEQDNLFYSPMQPGTAMLYSYEYTCAGEETKLTLDTSDNGKRAFPVAVKIPEQGFCKIVISFLENDKLFYHDEDLLVDHFERNQVAISANSIPYCDVIDTKGNTVSFVNKDSLNMAKYEAAVKAAANLTSDDIEPLVSIGPHADYAAMSGDNTQVILVAWHNDPDKFKDGEMVTLKDEVLWAYTDKEFVKWYNENFDKVKNWNLRLKQLLGKSPEFPATHFTVFWAEVKDLYRPANIPDVASSMMSAEFTENFESDDAEKAKWFKNWFDETKAKAYAGEGGFPWTRLGYTYDWGRTDGGKYGLSEFIVREGAQIDVKFTRGTKAFINWLNDRSNNR